jgi:GNAT superfamily N-acetyltransferase
MAVCRTGKLAQNICMRVGNRLKVQRAQPEAAASISSVLRFAFTDYERFYTKEGFAATTPDVPTVLARMREGPVWVATAQTRIIGTAAAVGKENGVYIRGMAVLPDARGMGAGKLLLQEVQNFALEAGADRLFLSTTPFLDRAIRLYSELGFHRTHEGPYELFGTPLLTMEKRLAQNGPTREAKRRSVF